MPNSASRAITNARASTESRKPLPRMGVSSARSVAAAGNSRLMIVRMRCSRSVRGGPSPWRCAEAGHCPSPLAPRQVLLQRLPNRVVCVPFGAAMLSSRHGASGTHRNSPTGTTARTNWPFVSGGSRVTTPNRRGGGSPHSGIGGIFSGGVGACTTTGTRSSDCGTVGCCPWATLATARSATVATAMTRNPLPSSHSKT